METGEGLRAILAGSSDLPLSAKKQVPIPRGELGLKPSDKQTKLDIAQAKNRDSVIRDAVKLRGASLERARKPQVERKPPSLWESMGNGLK